MASLYKRGSRYYAQFSDTDRSPTKKQLSLKTSDKGTARELLVEWERLVRTGQADPWTDDMHAAMRPDRQEQVTLTDALQRFIQSRRRRNLTENTLRTYEGICGRFIRQVGEDTQLSALTAADVSAYVFDGSVKAVTQKKRHTHLRAFLRWLEGEELLTENPMERIKPPKVDKKMPVACRPEELNDIVRVMALRYDRLRALNQIDEGEVLWKAAAFRFAFLTGLRRSEIARLRWRHIDFDAGTLHLHQQKNRTEQVLPIAAPAVELLRKIEPEQLRDKRGGREQVEYTARMTAGILDGTRRALEEESVFSSMLDILQHGPAEEDYFVFRAPGFTKTKRNQRSFGNNLSRTFRRYRRRAGVREALNFHSLRAGFCTALANAGKSAAQIKAAARHADIATSLRYIEQSTANVRDTVTDVFG